MKKDELLQRIRSTQKMMSAKNILGRWDRQDISNLLYDLEEAFAFFSFDLSS